jgi:hypothetical protein
MRAMSLRRLAGAAATLMLTGALLLTTTGSALAGKPSGGTRHLYVGPDSGYKNDLGSLTFTPVSSGGQSASNVYVKNVDNQTLTHVVISFARSQGGTTISQVLGTAASFCLPLGVTTVTCDFGNLTAGATRDFTLIVDTTVTESLSYSGTVTFNESSNPNGGNPQISTVSGTLAVSETTCDALATFLPPGIGKTLTPDNGACSTDKQRSSLAVPANANGSLVSLSDSNPATGCGAFTCFGFEVEAGVNNGATVSPYLTWFITYSADTIGSINPKLVGFLHGTTLIPSGKKGACGATFTKDCVAGITANSDGSVTFEIHTATNSVMKGLH